MARPVLDDRYDLDDLPIGRGGMGEVWGARDLRLDRRVAIKLIRFPDGTPDPELVRRFHRESRITARLEPGCGISAAAWMKGRLSIQVGPMAIRATAPGLARSAWLARQRRGRPRSVG
jgi:hypothetical protein